jgi:hypothetical protein
MLIKNYDKEFVITEDNINTFRLISKLKYGKKLKLSVSYKVFQLMISTLGNIKCGSIAFMSTSEYDEFVDSEHFDKYIGTIDINRKPYKNFSEKFILHLMKNHKFEAFYEISKNQKILEIFIIDNIKFFMDNIDYIRSIIKHQKLSITFVKNLLEKKSSDLSPLIVECQTCLNDELTKKYNIKQCKELIKHNISNELKIELIKKYDIDIYDLIINFDVKFSQELFNIPSYSIRFYYLMDIFCKIQLSKSDIKYLTDKKLDECVEFEKIQHIAPKIKSNEKMISFRFSENSHYHDLICDSNGMKDFDVCKYYNYKLYLLIILRYQKYIPKKVLIEIKNLIRQSSEINKLNIYLIALKNMNLFVDDKTNKILGIDKRLNSTLIKIKKLYDLKIKF